MFYVGIDIAKRSHVACVMKEDNTLEIKPFTFSSLHDGFKKLLIQPPSLSCDPSEVIIGMEATGLLFENLYRYLKEFAYRVVLLNPYQSAKFREMDTMKHVKNDNIDTGKYLLRGCQRGTCPDDTFQHHAYSYTASADATNPSGNGGTL